MAVEGNWKSEEREYIERVKRRNRKERLDKGNALKSKTA